MHMLKTLLPGTPMNEFKGVCRCKNATGQEYKHKFWEKGPKEWNHRTDPHKIFTCSSSGVSICTLQLLWVQFLYFCTMYFCTGKASKSVPTTNRAGPCNTLAHAPSQLQFLWCQYLYFCTRKSSKLSVCVHRTVLHCDRATRMILVP
jgi:hypothetical protein